MAELNKLAREIHENSLVHGWWEGRREFPEIAALIHSEVSEALEEYRNGRDDIYYVREEAFKNGECVSHREKPEGIPAELADVIIRVLDYCAYAGIDIDAAIAQKHEYNKTRPYRHGGKRC